MHFSFLVFFLLCELGALCRISLCLFPLKGSEKCRQQSRQEAAVPLLCVCLTCGALVVVSPCERAVLSTMTALTSSKRLATCAASAKPLPATLSW